MDSASVLDLTVSTHCQPQTYRISSRKRVTMRSPEEKRYAVELYNSGKTKAEVSRLLQIPESTLRGWLKEAMHQGLVSHMSSGESSPCSPASTMSGESNNDVIDLLYGDQHHLKTMSLVDESKGYMDEAKRVSKEWMQLLAFAVQKKENLRQSTATITPVPIKGKRKRKSQQEFLEESRNVSQNWLQHQKVAGQSVALNPNWQQLLQNSMLNDPKVHQQLLHQQFVQEQLQQQPHQQPQQQLINPFVTPEMVPQFQMLLLSRMMLQSNQAHPNSCSTPQPPPQKRRKIYSESTMDTPIDNQLPNEVQVQNLSMVGNYNSPLGGLYGELKPVVVPSPMPSPISTTEVEQKRSKLEMAMANASMNNSGAGQQPEMVESTTPSSKPAEVKQRKKRRSKFEIANASENVVLNNSEAGQQQQLEVVELATPLPNPAGVKQRKNKRSKIEVDPMLKLNEYFNTDYFMLHDWLLMQQQSIGESIMTGIMNHYICMD